MRAILIIGWLLTAALDCRAAEETSVPAANATPPSANEARRIIQLVNQNEALAAELAKLRGQLDELLGNLDKSRKQQRDMYKGLAERLERIEQERKAAAEDESAASLKSRLDQLEDTVNAMRAALANVDADSADNDASYRAYSTGLDAYRGGDYPLAIDAFQAFILAHPKHAAAADAQYWLGEALFRQREYASAISAQKKLIESYPDSTRTPDALLVIGSAELGLGNIDSARAVWATLISDHPQSDAAGKARKRLERIH